ncbi:molybdopterin cofactor-binding domain-containing protein [Pigmentiphaga humi]|uniref:molybdopterin cofactor-binding domain-containing protein n=1 Tax=Pigmentiphaga humi TaxID=2478468 RepID=UPI000F549EA5|nr:molybdopterin cofactor-binding domain-containing protein [Pigmentiphaga humi]
MPPSPRGKRTPQEHADERRSRCRRLRHCSGSFTSIIAGSSLGRSTYPTVRILAATSEIEVDTETGHIKILRLVSVADAGSVINPGGVATQLSGAAIMSLGGALLEHMQYVDGELTNGSLAYYKTPAFHDVPDLMEAWRCARQIRAGRSAADRHPCSPPRWGSTARASPRRR